MENNLDFDEANTQLIENWKDKLLQAQMILDVIILQKVRKNPQSELAINHVYRVKNSWEQQKIRIINHLKKREEEEEEEKRQRAEEIYEEILKALEDYWGFLKTKEYFARMLNSDES